MKIAFCLFLVVFTACKDTKNIEDYKQEVIQTELAFAQMAKEQGVKEAFLAFAADSAVLSRGNKILKRQQDFIGYFSNPLWKNASLQWKPDFVDVSASGDLAYTYGSYTFSSQDSIGKISTSRGIFHTVWKRQQDGSWKFVWD